MGSALTFTDEIQDGVTSTLCGADGPVTSSASQRLNRTLALVGDLGFPWSGRGVRRTTFTGDVLEYRPEGGIEEVVRVRVVTTLLAGKPAPAWSEIELLSVAPPD